ncbi:hypothetical protein BsWGS_20201 [Bradybaena similaris]
MSSETLESQITGEATIEKLPENILLEIMRYLSMKDRCRAARVCKQWNNIFSNDSLWRHVDLLEFPISLKALWRLVRTRFSPRMSTLKLRCIDHIIEDPDGRYDRKKSLSDAVLKSIAARCPNLEVLHIHHCHTKNFTFESLPTSIVYLEIAHCMLKLTWMTDKQKHLPILEHLKLINCYWVRDSVVLDISVWRNLKHLSIRNSAALVTISGFITIAINLHELEYLNLCNTYVDDYAVYHVTQNLKKLKELCLAKCHMVTDKGVVKIAMGLPVLNKLDISHCWRVTMKALKTLFGGSIRELVVVGLFNLSEEEKQALKRGFAVTRFR